MKFSEIISLGYNCEVSFRIKDYCQKHGQSLNSFVFSWAYVEKKEGLLKSLSQLDNFWKEIEVSGTEGEQLKLLPGGMYRYLAYDIAFHSKAKKMAFENGKTLNIDIEPDILYKGDLLSVKKIVSILLDNAVKHADPCGEILVTLKKENGKTVLTVFNSGSFVPTEDSNKVFERFYRGDSSRSRESGGSGLGLSIAKSIADINKWKINAVSIPEVSMTVTVVFN